MALDRVPEWWRKPRKARVAACYTRKVDALHDFADANTNVIEAAGGLDQPQGHLDAVNERYGLRGAKAVRTLGEAFWVAMPKGKPFCVEAIDLATLNETMEENRHGELRLPDHVVEERMLRQERDYYNAAELEGLPKGRTMLWIALAAISLGFLVRRKGGGVALNVSNADLARAVATYAGQRKIPADVILAWIGLESGGNANAYNPEPGVIGKWSKTITQDRRATWAANPDFKKAEIVARMLADGTSAQEIAAASKSSLPFKDRLWTFGSSGYMQVSRITAAENGYAANLPNAGLFDADTNIRVGTQVIASLRASLYPNKTDLTTFQWAIVRAAYVLGAGGVKSRLSQGTPAALAPVQDKQSRFYAALGKLRGAPVNEKTVEPTNA